MDRVFVTPVEGLKVRDPDHGMAHLPAEGREVSHSAYWARRLRAGEVTKVSPASKPSRTPPAKAASD